MTPEQNERVKELFYRWCEAPDGERAGVLLHLDHEETAVREELRAMIALDEASAASDDRFLEAPAFGADVIAGVIGRSGPPPALPATIGGYRIVREIGMGGMGVVYEAEQDSPRRTVALKIIRPGVASPRTLRRFEFEAEVLGRLQHPGIAQIFEAGTFDDGQGPQPFFAMELIRGRPLLAHAEEARLDARQRLRLVARIARAIQHAHLHGVVHRDLKPDNILVQVDDGTTASTDDAMTTLASEGQPKVLDFGVARITGVDLDVTTQVTDAGQLIGTIAYMSPEQARGRREDVDQRTDIYALGVIAYELLVGRRPHDLGGMGLPEAVRAIEEREPERLGSIDRDLRGDVETIVAKAMDRDAEARYGSAAEFAADIERFLTDQPVVARPPSASYQLRKFARRHRAVFAGGLIAVAAIFVGLVVTSLALAGALRNAQRARHEQAIATQVSAFLQTTLASIDPEAPSEARDLRELLDRAAARALELENAEVAQPVDLTIGRAYLSLAVFGEAERHLTRSHRCAIDAFGAGSAEEADVLEVLGDLRLATSELKEAETLYRRALGIRREVASVAAVAAGLNRLGACQQALGDYTAAEASLREALDMHERALGPDDLAVADDLHKLGVLLIDTNDLEEAEPCVTRALAIRRAILGDEHRQVADSLDSLGWLHRRAGRHRESERYYREGLAIKRAILPEGHPGIASGLERLAATVESQGRYDEADGLYHEALEIQRAALGPRHHDVGTTLNNIAGLLRRRGQYEEAARLYTEALSIYREQIGPDHVWTAIVLENLARTYELAGDLTSAEPYIEDCLRIRRVYFADRDEGQSAIAVAETLRAACLAERGAFAEAEPALVAAMAVLRDECGDEDARTRAGAERAARFYESWGRQDAAKRWSAIAAGDDPGTSLRTRANQR